MLDIGVILNFIQTACSYILGLFSNPAFANVFSALLGAIVGSVTGYAFNRQLEQKRTKERYLIQRKNTIYSPLYKQILALHEYLHGTTKLDSLNNRQQLFTISVSLSDEYSGYNDFNFSIWEDIKKDIRKNYIHTDQQAELENLTLKINTQLQLQNKVSNDIDQIAEVFMRTHETSLKQPTSPQQPAPNPKGIITGGMHQAMFPYGSTGNAKDFMVRNLFQYYTFSTAEMNHHVEELLETAKKLRSFGKLKRELRALVALTDQTANSFGGIIDKIINQYEGGIKIE